MSKNQLHNKCTNKSVNELLKNVGIFLKLREKANADTTTKSLVIAIT